MDINRTKKLDKLIEDLQEIREKHGNIETSSAGHNCPPSTYVATNENGEMRGDVLNL